MLNGGICSLSQSDLFLEISIWSVNVMFMPSWDWCAICLDPLGRNTLRYYKYSTMKLAKSGVKSNSMTFPVHYGNGFVCRHFT